MVDNFERLYKWLIEFEKPWQKVMQSAIGKYLQMRCSSCDTAEDAKAADTQNMETEKQEKSLRTECGITALSLGEN